MPWLWIPSIKRSYLGVKDLILDYTKKVLQIDFTRQLIEVDYKDYVEGHQGDGHLGNCSHYLDLWHNATEIPPYRYPSGERENIAIRTSILIPLREKDQAFGVINFETQEHIAITPEAKFELKNIAQAIAILYQRYLNFEENFNRTREAFSELNNLLIIPSPKLTKPKIFLASSTRANADVIDILMNVLKDYQDRLDVVYGKDMHQPGNINSQLLKELGQCRYGICYMSEPTDDPHVYQDNLNVIFEAGMLHGRSDFHLEFPASWIPIREEKSDKIPFDFASERMMIVVRDEDGSLDVERFKQNLCNRLDALLFGKD